MNQNAVPEVHAPESCIHPQDQRQEFDGVTICGVCKQIVVIQGEIVPAEQTPFPGDGTRLAELKKMKPADMTAEELADIVIEWKHTHDTYVPFFNEFLVKVEFRPRDSRHRWLVPIHGCYSIREFCKIKLGVTFQAAYKARRNALLAQSSEKAETEKKLIAAGIMQPQPPKVKPKDQKDERIACLEDDMKHLKKVGDEKDDDIDRLSKEVSQLRKVVEAYEKKDHTAAHQALDAANAKVKQLEGELLQEKAKVTGHLKTITAKDKEIERQKKTIIDLRAQLTKKKPTTDESAAQAFNVVPQETPSQEGTLAV